MGQAVGRGGREPSPARDLELHLGREREGPADIVGVDVDAVTVSALILFVFLTRQITGLELDLDAGVTTLRRFEYPDRNYRLNGDNVGWLSITLNHRF
jgi:hypothetical protein